MLLIISLKGQEYLLTLYVVTVGGFIANTNLFFCKNIKRLLLNLTIYVHTLRLENKVFPLHYQFAENCFYFFKLPHVQMRLLTSTIWSVLFRPF